MTIKDAIERERIEAEARRLGLTPTQVEMNRAVGTDLIADIVRDNRRNVHDRPGMFPAEPTASAYTKPTAAQGGWIEPPKVSDWKPPGLGVLDRMMDAQDARDRADATRRNGGRE